MNKPEIRTVSAGAGRHEVVQLVLDKLSSHAQALSAVTRWTRGYDREAAGCDGATMLDVTDLDDGRKCYTVLAYWRTEEDMS